MKSDKQTKRKRARMEETTTPKKPTSRTRSRNASASSAAAAGGGASHSAAALGESKIVWKDSPVEKHIKVSGTGKLAVRKEMQGFVGRLARASASAESPPTIVDELPIFVAATTEATPTLGRQAIGGINKGGKEPLSRHLLFSPEKSNPRSTPPRHSRTAQAAGTSTTSVEPVTRTSGQSDSQDDMVSILDQMNEKYSVDGAPSSSAVPAETIAPQKASSTSEAKVTTHSPMPIQRPQAPVSVAAVAAPALPVPAPAPSAFSTPKKQINRSTIPDCDSSNSVEFGSPLTEESWDFLDQLEMQASQRIVSSQSIHQQVSHPTRRPSGTSVAKRSLPLSPAPVPTVGAVVYDKSVDVAPLEDYKRLLVLEVDRDAHQRRLTLMLLDDQDRHIEAILMEDWYDTCVEAGDTVNIIFTELESSGFFSQNDPPQQHPSKSCDQTGRVQVDNEHNLIIVFPDILVSPTSITTSFGCLRRAIICETLKVSSSRNEAALLGTLKHELFEKAVLSGRYDMDFLLEESTKIVVSNILDLVDCGLNEEKAFSELRKVMEDYHVWLTAAFGSKGVAVNGPPAATNSRVKIRHVLATEEMMWSIKWGLKGATDASVEATFTSPSVNLQHPTETNVVLPIELKTGSKNSGLDHQGQVILYTLLLNERYRLQCQDGLLLYAPGIETNRIAAMGSHIRGLTLARNKVAYSMAHVKALGSATSSNAYPPMLRSHRVCKSCFQADQCYLHHAAIENGTPESSGLDEIFSNKIGHLSSTDLAYFKQWIRMIDLEQQHSEKSVRALWLEVGWKREKAQENCVAELELVSDEASHPNSGANRTLRFQRNRRQRLAIVSKPSDNPTSPAGSFLDQRLRVDDRVILSAESLDGKRVLVHVARGKIVSVERSLLTVDIMQSIPSTVKSGRTAIGKNFTWRLDKDIILSALNRAKDNLVKLFVGEAPETTSNGTAIDDRPGVLVTQAITPSDSVSTMGDSRRRNLIVHLSRPRFKSSAVVDLIQQRTARDVSGLLKPQASILIDEFQQLNIDQQRAVQKVLNSLDYALILGMPGTGKTSTIAFAVRLLIFMGFSVLVTSYTHSAVDNMLMKLLQFKIPMLRIGNSAQVHPLLAEYTLEYATKSEAISTVKEIEDKMLSAKLVGCTCLSVNHVLFKKRRFDFCIVDEATQTTQPVVLGALRCADTFVLVGDHYQLPPLVASSQARKEGMDVSLFRRLSEAHPVAIQHLSFQYRMNADIMLLANQLIYGNKLKCGSFHVAANQLPLKIGAYEQLNPIPWPFDVLKSGKGVAFLNTDPMGIATETRAGKSSTSGRRRMENQVEAALVAGLIEVMIYGGIKADDIAVISPFHAQVSLIQSQVKLFTRDSSVSLEGIEVSTIDKYQGKDKDVILVSFVRCNPEKRVGELLADWRRINVALTRAKQKLLLVGSLSTLRDGCPLFHNLDQVIQNCRWEYCLATDALEALQKITTTIRKSPMIKHPDEPDPEKDTTIPMARSDDQVSIYGLRRANDDIEGLVPDVVKIPKNSRESVKQVHPITRDIQGGF